VAPALSLGRLPVPSRSKFRAVRGFVAFLIRRVSERPFLNRGCRVALKSETRRVRLHFLPLIVRFDCHRAYASCTPLRDVINRSEQTLLLLEGAQ